MINQSGHDDLILWESLLLWVLNHLVVHCQNIVNINFLHNKRLMIIKVWCTYPLSEILNKNTYGLHVLGLFGILHHLLHVLLHFWEVAL